jgi:hypothetical protein
MKMQKDVVLRKKLSESIAGVVLMKRVLPTSRPRREPVKKSVSASCVSRKLVTVALERMSCVARKRRKPGVLQERNVGRVRKKTDNERLKERSDVLADVTVNARKRQETGVIMLPSGVPWIVASRMLGVMNVDVLAYTTTI